MHSINNYKFKSLVGFLKNKFISSSLSSLDNIQKRASFKLCDLNPDLNRLSLLSVFKSLDSDNSKSYIKNADNTKKTKSESNSNKISIKIDKDKSVSILSLNKILAINESFSILSHTIRPRLDNYSLAFFKTVDSAFRNSNDNVYNIKYLKSMKVKVIDIFNSFGRK